MQGQLTKCQEIGNQSIVWAVFLGFVSGFPLLLTSSTLQAWCVAYGHSLVAIGSLSLLGWPYLLKVFWAPMLDRPLWRNNRSGKRAWIVLLCVGIGLSLVLMSCSGPKHYGVLLVLAGFVAWCAATLDAAIDGYRIEQLDPKDYGVVAGGGMVMYRMALMIAGGGLLIFADHFSWSGSYDIAAVIMFSLGFLCCMIPAKQIDQRQLDNTAKASYRSAWRGALKLGMTQQQTIWFLAWVIIFKAADAFVVNLGPAFLLRHCHLSLTHLGVLYKVAGVIATLMGAMLAGFLLKKKQLDFVVFSTLIVQLLSIGCYVGLTAVHDAPIRAVDLTVVFECFSSGMVGTVLITMLMRCCDPMQAATRYAFLSAFPAVARILIGPVAGWIAKDHGWLTCFSVALCCAMIPLALMSIKAIQGALLHLSQKGVTMSDLAK